MPEYSDIYVISERRDESTIDAFLNHFLPKREESADEYEYPQYAHNSEIVFERVSEVIAKCIEDSTAEYNIYWRATENAKPEHAMVFFLSDGNVIYGLSTDASNQPYAKRLLRELKDMLGSPLGYIGHEASPDATNLQEFKIQAKAHNP